MKSVKIGWQLAAAVVLASLLAGCVMVVNYAPSAERAALYSHSQEATNMVITQDIPVTAQLVDKLESVIGAQVRDNQVKGIEANVERK